MAELVVRPATPADVPAIAPIYQRAVTEGLASWEYDPPDEAEMRRRFDAVVLAGYPYLVAAFGDRIVGYAYASAYRTRPGYRFTVENSVYVATDVQRSGAGRALLVELVTRCAAAGFRQMVAVIGDSANHASIGLHRACGFTHCGTLRSIGWKHGQWLDSVLMQRSLGAADTSPPLV
ncbi:MAG: GNAT family N-acetyltransferase [Hyphomicrobiaceae bacterium]|nr:GNAT family N-acetyltransferase [Hyphomicrobiaceae bacterium]